MMLTAIIPARGGSKRIPKKNLKLFKGKPIIQYTIDTAKKFGIFKDIIVSTDDKDIADYCTSQGITVFDRPSFLSDDHTPIADVVIDTLEKLKYRPSYTCCMLATAPFMSHGDITMGFKKVEYKYDTVMPVSTFDYPIQRALSVGPAGVDFVIPENEMARSQDLKEYYHDAGQWYWLDTRSFLSQKKIFMTKTQAIILPRYRVQDIDTQEDWIRAENIYESTTQEKLR